MTVRDRDLLGAKSSSCSIHPKPVVVAVKQDEMSASLVQCGPLCSQRRAIALWFCLSQAGCEEPRNSAGA
jgi:hypothetical protein